MKEGEYLLAVNGNDLKPPTELYSLFENTAGKIDRDHRRPERRRQGLAHRDRRADRQRIGACGTWTGSRGTCSKVEKATDGKVALRLRAGHRRRRA